MIDKCLIIKYLYYYNVNNESEIVRFVIHYSRLINKKNSKNFQHFYKEFLYAITITLNKIRRFW